MSRFPEDPTAQVGFGIYTQEDGKGDFVPVYYPERFTYTTEKGFQKTAANCEGQRVSIKEVKNSTLHATGKIHETDLRTLDDLSYTFEPVDVLTPVLQKGGMEAFVKTVERGEYVGFDRFQGERMFKYTIDLKSTGKDEYESASQSRYGSSSGSESNDTTESSVSYEELAQGVDLPQVTVNGDLTISVDEYIQKTKDSPITDGPEDVKGTIIKAAEKTLDENQDLTRKQIRLLNYIIEDMFA
jgi:hypothetical protein